MIRVGIDAYRLPGASGTLVDHFVLDPDENRDDLCQHCWSYYDIDIIQAHAVRVFAESGYVPIGRRFDWRQKPDGTWTALAVVGGQ
jgi:hypothetical protein